MLVDTDVLIWNLRGNEAAAKRLDAMPGFAISAVTYMELLQGLRDKAELRTLRAALVYWQAGIVDINPRISSRACFLLEEHALGDGLQMADALIAATALEAAEPLLTANVRHYKAIASLELEGFVP